ncbi:MAG: peptide deformylase [Catalinimonas sp.]
MIYPIVAYGDLVLKRRAEPIDFETFDVKQLVEDMFETMDAAQGVGLAAPQIGKSVRLFVVDAEPMDEANLKGFRRAFVNPDKVEESGDVWPYEEGCLSIPGIRGDVLRPSVVTLRFQDLDGQEHTETFGGMAARVIQHEYDHLEGVLFTDHLKPFKRRLLSGKLNGISRGRTDAEYRMRFPVKTRR